MGIRTCYLYRQAGHTKTDCPVRFQAAQGLKNCYTCHQAGHLKANCPQSNKQGSPFPQNGPSQPFPRVRVRKCLSTPTPTLKTPISSSCQMVSQNHSQRRSMNYEPLKT
ncbi:hypothetical protein K450DRAFT_233186 [Umbelopsis ramanniana AG]|uniref:CCHC-type domain-containing protein n=1 Tax=Umbelopsis ramanniana AG TaxID=1314678 RepID=A0AAD5EBZ9_UMBRA|nr:uncharacterized protein K450DRAFT_233186 [Umbelopsis ramanniana AG]KAI8581121.1 hypothetical protein K450DRAFT_233186 [Umbelopsis ramanniana AG]